MAKTQIPREIASYVIAFFKLLKFKSFILTILSIILPN